MISELSNPFSTGGGGPFFEAQVQASFVVLLLAKGFVPCMPPNWPIKKIMLQGKYAGYNTDDLIVFVEKPSGNEERKILGQIKHSISITQKNKLFGEVIEDAWRDFNDTHLFSMNKDSIALITGPLSATDINDTRTILEWARSSENASNFFYKMKQGKFSSDKKRNKLQAFRTHLNKANEGQPISDDDLFEFMKHFHLLGYDLDIEAGVTTALLHSLIGQYAPERASDLWARIVYEVQSVNKNAGVITRDLLPEDLQSAFEHRPYEVMPEDLSTSPLPSDEPEWDQYTYVFALVIANLLGAWDEQNEADLEIINQLSEQE